MFISRLDDNDYALPANDEWTALKAKMIVTELSRRPVGGIKEEKKRRPDIYMGF